MDDIEKWLEFDDVSESGYCFPFISFVYTVCLSFSMKFFFFNDDSFLIFSNIISEEI